MLANILFMKIRKKVIVVTHNFPTSNKRWMEDCQVKFPAIDFEIFPATHFLNEYTRAGLDGDVYVIPNFRDVILCDNVEVIFSRIKNLEKNNLFIISPGDTIKDTFGFEPETLHGFWTILSGIQKQTLENVVSE